MLEPRRDHRRTDLADPRAIDRWSARRGATIAGERVVHRGQHRVALGGVVDVEVRDHGQEVIAREALATKELGVGDEPAQRLAIGAWSSVANSVEHRERTDVGHVGERRLRTIDSRECLRRPRIVRFEHEEHELRLGKDRLERSRGSEVGIVGHDQAIDRAFGRDVHRPHRRERHEHGVDRDHHAAEAQQPRDQPRPAIHHCSASRTTNVAAGVTRRRSHAETAVTAIAP